MADFRHNPGRVVIFFSCRASAACATTSSIWADKSYATTALTFCAATKLACLLRSPYQVHLHQDNQPDAPPGCCKSRPDACTVLVKYSLACELNCFSTWSWWDCVVIVLSFYCLIKKGAPNVGLPCGRPDIPYLSGLPGLNSTSSGL